MTLNTKASLVEKGIKEAIGGKTLFERPTLKTAIYELTYTAKQARMKLNEGKITDGEAVKLLRTAMKNVEKFA